MRAVSLFVWTVVALVCRADDIDEEDDVLTLEQAYGPVAGVSTLRSWAERNSNVDRGSKYLESRSNGQYPLEIVLVEDATLALTAGQVLSQLDSIYSVIGSNFAGAKIGLSSFIDKPRFPYGSPVRAYCYRKEAELAEGVTAVTSSLQSLQIQGSSQEGDIWNSQFDAVVNTVEAFQWSAPTDTPVRLIVLITPAPPHFSLDGLNVFAVPEWSSPDLNQCLTQYYPAPANIAKSLQDSETYLMVVVTNGLSQPLAYQNFNWLISYLGFTPDFVSSINDPARLTTAIQTVIGSIKGAETTATTPTGPPTTTTEIITSPPITTNPLVTTTEMVTSPPITTTAPTEVVTTVPGTPTPLVTTTEMVTSPPITTTPPTEVVTTVPGTPTTTEMVTSPPITTTPPTEVVTTVPGTPTPLVTTTVPGSPTPLVTTTAMVTSPPVTTTSATGTVTLLPITPTTEAEDCLECPEVEIKLKQKPKRLELFVSNE